MAKLSVLVHSLWKGRFSLAVCDFFNTWCSLIYVNFIVRSCCCCRCRCYVDIVAVVVVVVDIVFDVDSVVVVVVAAAIA